MIQEILYDEVKDFGQVVPGLAMSVTEALLTGVVKDTIDTSPYTKETDVTVIGNYVTDNIEVAMALKKIGKSISELPTATSPKTPSGGETA